MDEAELVDPVLRDPFVAPTHDLGPEDVSEPEEGDGEEEDGGGELVVQPVQPGVHPVSWCLGLEEGRDPDHWGQQVHHVFKFLLCKYQSNNVFYMIMSKHTFQETVELIRKYDVDVDRFIKYRLELTDEAIVE